MFGKYSPHQLLALCWGGLCSIFHTVYMCFIRAFMTRAFLSASSDHIFSPFRSHCLNPNIYASIWRSQTLSLSKRTNTLDSFMTRAFNAHASLTFRLQLRPLWLCNTPICLFYLYLTFRLGINALVLQIICSAWNYICKSSKYISLIVIDFDFDNMPELLC